MSKIIIIGAGAMGAAFALPCLDNNHDVNILGTHLENEFIDNLNKNKNFHSGLNTQIPEGIKIFKFEKCNELLKSNVDLVVLAISSKGIEWAADQLSQIYKNKTLPKLLMLTKGLSLHENKYELLVDKLERLLKSKGINEIDISAVGGPCLAAGLANKVHSSVVIANKDIDTAKKIADMLNTNYYHTSYSDDLNGDSLTGGYIVKIDKFTGSGGASWLSNFPNLGGGSTFIQYHYPEGAALHPLQKNYIENFVDSFEYALASPNFNDSLIGYSKYIDVNSFIDLYIINELSRNIDGYRLSTYMYKDRDDNGGKLTMGPLWDYNLAFGNANFCNGGITSGWEIDDGGQGCAWNNPFWFERLLDDTNYVNKLKCRWEYLRDNSFHEDSIFNFIDSTALYIDHASQRNFQKWDILGTYVWPNYYVGNTYQDEINFLKNWIGDRLVWIDTNLLGNCYGIVGCTDPNACNFNQFANYDDGSCIYDSYSYDTLVSNSNINWNGIVLYVSGDYSIVLTNSLGCDSCLLYTSPSPRDRTRSRMPSSA